MQFHSMQPYLLRPGEEIARKLKGERRHSLALMFLMCMIVLCAVTTPARGQGRQNQGLSDLSPAQRLDVMRSKLEAMRRSLDAAIGSTNAKDTSAKDTAAKDKTTDADDPRERLRGLQKEVGSVLNEVNDLHQKQDKSERYDVSQLDGLESSVADLKTRVEAALQSTASARTAETTSVNYQPKPEKGKKRLFGLLGHSGGSEKYSELTGSVVAGRDRVLFEDATREVRKGNHETGRLLFNTIITTYPDSPYLSLSKLAIADSFYLEGSTSSLIQAGQAYQDWLTYFPTDPLADAAMLKVAEAEMRQMGLPDRQIPHATKAEQRLKALLQQFPETKLRPEVEERLHEVQDNLAMHELDVGRFYWQRYTHKNGGLRGAQERFKGILEKYPNFCYTDEVLFRTGITYQEEEEPDEAAKYFQQLVRDYPNSDWVDQAKEQLKVIGAPIPEPDPIKKNLPACQRATFKQNLMQQITGNANVTTSHDGILITRHGEGKDLIDAAIANNGQLPPQPAIVRTPPAHPSVNQPAPAPPPAESTPEKRRLGISIQPTPNGAMPDRINPSTPSTPPGTTQTPATKPEPAPKPETKPPADQM